MRDLYQEVTNRIVAELEQGVKPWTKPWKLTAHAAPMLPANMQSGRHYQGVNTLVLWVEAYSRGFPTHQWMTYPQAIMLGGHVRKGEQGVAVVFAKPIEKEVDGKTERSSIYRWYTVFNASQIEGIEIPDYGPPEIPEMSVMASIREKSGVPVSHGHPAACYYPKQDRIEMPAYAAFHDGQAYARVLFHELAHATGHEKRLNRDMEGRFGDDKYAMEELVAELSAAFTSARIGCHYSNESAQYIDVWVRRMKEDSRAIFTASSMAAKATDWLYEKAMEEEKTADASIEI